ncbi:uncharacterized protein F54H12.2-like [Pleurodeles waltl]|uniref:uncharacterized protein F54H12.2-like n=1 Tax=Pleurodeles waltl TaxID=8319 RepID=UPI003709832D
MAFVHFASGECTKSELDLFSLKPTQTSIENSFFMEVLPLAALTLLAVIEFFVSGSTAMYLDLNKTKANSANIDDDAKVALIAYPVTTMFNQVDINLGDRLVTQSDNMYAYRAYIESTLNYNCEALDTQLSAELFYKDTHAHFEDTALDGGNDGFKKRASFATGSRRGDAEQYKLVILSASLFVKRVKVSTSVRLAHAEALQLLNAKYAIERVALKIFSIPAGTQLTQQQNLFMDQLPKLIIIGFVDHTAFSGLHTSNPFNFKHYDINYAALVHEGAVIPAKLFTPSFETSNFVREYLGLVSITGKHLHDSGVVVSREGYGTGYTLFAFDLTPDMDDSDHYNLIKNGNQKA